MERWNWLRDLIAGAPSPENVAGAASTEEVAGAPSTEEKADGAGRPPTAG
jgi:hypothetical protein